MLLYMWQIIFFIDISWCHSLGDYSKTNVVILWLSTMVYHAMPRKTLEYKNPIRRSLYPFQLVRLHISQEVKVPINVRNGSHYIQAILQFFHNLEVLHDPEIERQKVRFDCEGPGQLRVSRHLLPSSLQEPAGKLPLLSQQDLQYI